MNKIIKALKNYRKQSYLKNSFQHSYAFVGIGNHSINNLYPVLHYLRVPLKYIVVNSSKNAALIDANFQGIKGTNNYDEVLHDPEIKGVLICADPDSHYELVKKALEHNKHVFIEKPPCKTETELKELITLEKQKNSLCLVGMQKRYSPITQTLRKKLSGTILSYNYRFVTGPYPEGDSLMDIFIHPLDLVTCIFGDYTNLSVQFSNNDTCFIHITHKGFVGSIELSTQYSWKNAEESLIVNTSSGVYKMKNMDMLTFEKKSGTIFSIPIEKIKKSNDCIQVLFNRNNFNPIFENNQLYSSGYYNEINNFVNLCENKKGENLSSLSEMENTYKLIQNIKNQKNVR